MKVKIFGYGEIGKSLANVYRRKNYEPAWQDLKDSYGDIECDLLHVCIPYNIDFCPKVLDEILNSNANYVIIHSTVEVGITSLIQKSYPNKTICHSPVIGVHPNLTESMITFRKWIGYDTNQYKEVIKLINHLWSFDIPAFLLGKPEATEIMKLWDTTYYGMCLTINAEVKEMLEKYDVEYYKWVDYLTEYNIGYDKMHMPNVQRPYFPKLEMPIGGHCIIPNYNILKEITDMSGFNLLDKYSPK